MRGYRVFYGNCVCYVSAPTGAKARWIVIKFARAHGWGRYDNDFAQIHSCGRWIADDGQPEGFLRFTELP